RLKRRWSATLPDVLDRVHWLPPLPREEFLSLLMACDVLLDPYPFGGGNSSYEALALGVPLVTLPAPLLRGRLTFGLYRKMGYSLASPPVRESTPSGRSRWGSTPPTAWRCGTGFSRPVPSSSRRRQRSRNWRISSEARQRRPGRAGSGGPEPA